ncbi:MAG: acyl-CoA synthetase [Deltaproteobacteria bacterium]|nr:acyl-CoA synthetase [Deltaproteobacteria bacterium]
MVTEKFVIRNLTDVEAIESVPFQERVPALNTYEVLRHSAETYADTPAIIFLPNGALEDEPVVIEYRDLFARVTQAANMFNDLGVSTTSPVSYILPNLPQTHYTFWGGSAAGIVSPINYMLQPEQIAELLEAAGSKILVTIGPDPRLDIWQKVQAVRELVPSLEGILVVGGEADPTNGIYSFDDLLERYPADKLTSGRQIDPDDIASYLHTGGTTGSPKIAQQKHNAQVYIAWCLGPLLNAEPGFVTLCGLPLFHCNAVFVSGLGPFLAGATCLLAGPIGYRNPTLIKDFWRIVERYKVAAFSGVPTLYATLQDVPLEGVDVNSLRWAACGAAPMPVSLFHAFQEKTGIKILEGYGMTEGVLLSTIGFQDAAPRIGSIGIRVPYQQVKTAIVDADGKYVRNCEVDEIGVVAIKGPNVFPGYLQEKYNKNIWIDEGWFNTGDLGRIDEDGYFRLTGRAKDLIIRGGHNIDPATIEDTLQKHPAVEIAAAVGKPNAYAGELPVAYVTLKEGQSATPEELTAFARQHIPERPATPKEVFILQEMPLTAVGKIFKPSLRYDAIKRTLAAALSTLWEGDLSISIEVDSHDVHGTLASITITSVKDRALLKEKIDRILVGFAVKYNITFIEKTI